MKYLILLKDYINTVPISKQAVYKQIKNNKIETVTIGKQRYVVSNDNFGLQDTQKEPIVTIKEVEKIVYQDRIVEKPISDDTKVDLSLYEEAKQENEDLRESLVGVGKTYLILSIIVIAIIETVLYFIR